MRQQKEQRVRRKDHPRPTVVTGSLILDDSIYANCYYPVEDLKPLPGTQTHLLIDSW